MPKEGDRSHKDDPQERRNHRSSSSHHHRGHKHSARYRERSREHHRHRPYHRETTPRSSTRIYFNGSDSAPSVSLHTDHVTLASNLSSLWEKRQIGGMLQVFEDCCQMLDRLRQDQTTQPPFWPPGGTSTSCSSGHRGANQSNLVTVPKSPAKKSKPSFSEVIEKCKKKSLVPVDHTKQWLHQRLASHSEAKLESIDISLFCPLTHSRMVTPVRGQNCRHIHCFDGEAFCNLMWDKPSSKWKCPICKCLTPLSALVVDGFILEILASVPEDVRTVEFTSRGFWRIKETTSLKAINAPPNTNHDHGDNEVIDLTFDTPQKVVKKNSSDSNGNFVPQVIDLTLSLSP